MTFQMAQPTLRRMILRLASNHLGEKCRTKTAWPNLKNCDGYLPLATEQNFANCLRLWTEFRTRKFLITNISANQMLNAENTVIPNYHCKTVLFATHYIRTAFFWGIAQRVVLISYRCFGITRRPPPP